MAQPYASISLSAFLHSDMKTTTQFHSKPPASPVVRHPTTVSTSLLPTTLQSVSSPSSISPTHSASSLAATLHTHQENGLPCQDATFIPKQTPLRRRYVSTPCSGEDYQPLCSVRDTYLSDTVWTNSTLRSYYSPGAARLTPHGKSRSEASPYRNNLLSVNLRSRTDPSSLYPRLFQHHDAYSKTQHHRLPLTITQVNTEMPSIKRSKSFASPPIPLENAYNSDVMSNLSESLEAAAAASRVLLHGHDTVALVESLSNIPLPKNLPSPLRRSQKLKSPIGDETARMSNTAMTTTAPAVIARLNYKSGVATSPSHRKLVSATNQPSPLPPKPTKPGSFKRQGEIKKDVRRGQVPATSMLSPFSRMSGVSSEGEVASDYCSDDMEDADETDMLSTTSMTPTSGIETVLMGGEDELAQLDDENISELVGEDHPLEVDKMPLYDQDDKVASTQHIRLESTEVDKEFAHLLPKHSIHVVPLFSNPSMKHRDECGMYSPLIPSLFPNTPPVIRFVPENEKVHPFPQKYKKTLKWRMSTITPLVVKRAVARSGFCSTSKSKQWMGYFGKHMKATGFRSILDHQKINHFPGSFQIGRKDRLYRNLCRQRCQFGREEYDFFPLTYCLPSDSRQVKKIFEEAAESGVKQKWIVKPPAAARGIGVKVISKWSQVPKRRPMVVQQYISKPYLIEGSKFDLRVYVYVSSMDPLRVYVYDNGLVRFASQPYSSSLKSLNNRFMHLTNYSVNKKNSKYTSNDDGTVCQGHKWTLKSLWTYLSKQGVDCDKIWSRIKDLVVKTIIAAESSVNSLVKMHVRRRACVHEVFGFDVLLDRELKPWILEVNISPSLHSNSPLDVQVKSSMITDMFNTAGFQIPPRECFSSKSNQEVNVPLAIPQASQTAMTAANLSSTSGSRTVPASPIGSCRGVTSTSTSRTAAIKYSLTRPHSLDVNSTHCAGKSNSRSGTPALVPPSDSNHLPAWQSSHPRGEETDESSSVDGESSCDEDHVNNNSTHVKSSFNVKPFSSHSSSTWFADLRLWDKTLTAEEKAKHAFYSQLKFSDKMMNTILDNLTVDDVRILCESVDEWSRTGAFERVFPLSAEEGLRYLRFLQQPNRYYNCLLHQFLTRYQHKIDEGITLLQTLCQQQFHLNKNAESNRWRPPT